MARQVRGQLIALKEQEFSMAALVIGASDARILFRHLLINAIGPIIVQITFLVPNAIFTEAFLSFIGIGISAPMASWGSMAQDARQVLTMHPGQLLASTRLSVAEIAAQVGYLNQSKFASVFKKHFGVSPLEYRRTRHLDS